LPCLAPFCSLKEINRLEQHFHLTTCPNFPDQLYAQDEKKSVTIRSPAEQEATSSVVMSGYKPKIEPEQPEFETEKPEPEFENTIETMAVKSEELPHPARVSTPMPDQDSGPSAPGLLDTMAASILQFFTSGNLILKIGLFILFFGVAFLLKYAAERSLVPIEFRLSAVALGGLALLIIGWRLRHKKMVYGLILQGGGFGILYLTVFAAAKFYQLLPYTLALVIMIGLVSLTGILSVFQEGKWLAISGIVGGFLAPVLMSTGSGSHVALFSYYALLNLGIFGIAWFKAWRILNLVGFVFTFGIASLWGSKYYQPAYFNSVEPFLILFFILYVAVPILFASRLPLNLKGYVDSPIVFGMPIIAFGLQYGLVRGFEYGLAISALALGLFYMLIAMFLWRRREEGMRMLTEIFLSFGVIFGSLAIPLALDGRWTTAAWAMEGAGLVWIGVKQQRLKARLFGLLLQIGASISFLLSLDTQTGNVPVVNGFFLGCLVISMAAMVSSYLLNKHQKNIQPWEAQFCMPFMAWSLLWWFGGGIREIDRFVPSIDQVNSILIFIALSAWAMGYVSRRLQWRQLGFSPLGLLPVIILFSLDKALNLEQGHLFARWGVVVWILTLGVQYELLKKIENIWPEKIVPLYHQITLWLILFIATREAAWWVHHLVGPGIWVFITWGIIPSLGLLTLLFKGIELNWPVKRFLKAYLEIGTAVPVLFLLIWCVATNLRAGNPTPIPYFPIFNPLEISQIFVLVVLLRWSWQSRAWLVSQEPVLMPQFIYYCLAIISFLWLNAAVGRGVHFWTHVPYTTTDLFQSNLFQAAISILWSLIALTSMVWSARKLSRHIWLCGAILLTGLVLKLFVVDLSGSGSVGRIVSFIGVGILMLIIGYFSPLPPKKEEVTS